MVARTNRASGRIAVSVLVISIGITLILAGSKQLTTLAGAYRTTDILLTETPGSFQVWLAGLAQEAEDPEKVDGRNGLSRRVADRLKIMPLPDRHSVTISMAQAEFWDDINPYISIQRTTQEDVLGGVLLALQSEPGAGDLYFCAAWLETTLYGFGERPRRLLEASQIFSPHEIDFAIERLILAPLIWRFLREDERAWLKKDLNYVTNTYPNSAAQIIKELKEQGVSFD